MRVIVYVVLILVFRIQGENVDHSNNQQCIYSVYKYKYVSKAVFQYLPTQIINQTTLNIHADVDYFQSKSPCNQSFIKLHNLIIDPYDNVTIDTDTRELEKSIREIFTQTTNINSTEELIFSNDYENTTRRIKTIRIHNGRFIGNSIFANYLLNKLFSSTKTTCENLINLNQNRLENSICQSTIAGLLNINRQIYFDKQTPNQKFNFSNENITFIQLNRKTKDDFDRLLKQVCSSDDYSQYQFNDIMNNELNDQDLNQILFSNITQYSQCERTIINRNIIQVKRSPATDYILKTFANDQLMIEYHFDLIERQSNENLKKYFNNSYQISNFITLRMLILISDDNLTIQCGLNRNNQIKYRAIALRSLTNPMNFHDQFRRILNNEQESFEIRILVFQYLLPNLNSSEIDQLIKTVQSKQLCSYIKSLFKQSSIWLSESGSYKFPFGEINLIFNDNSPSIIPSIIQFQLANNTEIDVYLIMNSEILLIFGRKSIVRFSTLNDFLKWLTNDRLFEMKTLDGFYLKLSFKTEFNQWKNLFQKSNAGIIFKVQHGLNGIATGYEIRLSIESNFKINIYPLEYSTSYVWRSIQKENILFKIEQIINPLIGQKQFIAKSISSSTKDFCYIIPHFDSKLCLSFTFERLWPSSTAIRLLSDDSSLIYNLTSSDHSLLFNIQQNEQIFRTYRLLREYSKHSSFPTYLELSTPTTNYTSFINWNNPNIISFNLLKNNHSIANGSGVYEHDLSNRFSMNLTEIHPNHIGEIFVIYHKNLTIIAPRLFGGELMIQIDRLSNWKHGQIEIKAERAFFFFKQNFFLHFFYDINQPSFNLTFIRNSNSQFQWALIRNTSDLKHLFIINTSLLEINHRMQGYYYNTSNMEIQTSTLINGWSLWNISAMVKNARQVQIRLNRIYVSMDIDYRTMLFEIKYFNQRFLRMYFHINQSKLINVVFDIPGYCYESQGKLSADYTNFSLDFPILENRKKKSNIHFEFSSLSPHLILNLTSNIRNQYFFTSLSNFTFRNHYFYQSNIHSSLKMLHYQLFTFDLFAQYLPNSTILQSFNGSLILPSLFFSKPLLFTYEKHSQLFIQFFEWANLTRTSISSNISTVFGLHLSMINDLSTRISFTILGRRYLLIIEIDRNWMISLILNEKLRYEFISSPIDSKFLIKRIDLPTNQTRQLSINYYTDNQTLFRIEILFSKYFSRFINDFILDISFKNHSLKVFCFLPLFKREFFSLTWNRYLQKELFHFHGFIESKFLRRRRLIDYEYNWNFASIRFWTLESKLSLFSFDPIQWNFNLTNDYLWNGKWIVDYRLMLGHRRELIRLNHQYHYTTLISNLLFNLYLVNSNYDLNLNYYHSNHSIKGVFIKDKHRHEINGSWNRRKNSLRLNTQYMKSKTIIKSNYFKLIIDKPYEKFGILFERTTNQSKKDKQILKCNPYLIIRSYPRLFLIDYYTLNDGLSKMMFEWSTRSYLSWNYTGHGRILFPLRKFEIDVRTKYLFRFDTSTFKYSSIYDPKTHQLIIRRDPISLDADDRFILKTKFYHNQTFLIHIQILNNHYELIGHPSNENSYWKFSGYLHRDRFNGSLMISNSDWLLSSKLNFNSSLYISTGKYVQLIPTSDAQIALEIRLNSRFHFVFQYSGLHSLIALKFFHNSSNINLYLSSKSINETTFNLHFQFNKIINQNWTLEMHNQRFYLVNHNSEFRFNGSLQDFSFEHLIENKKTEFFINENSIGYLTNEFHLILSNLSSDTTKYFHAYHQPSKQNLTINYYKSGRFFMENLNIQTPIYDINAVYYPIDDENRYVKVFFEFLPLQMSSFSFVRGRTFRIGYETPKKKCILSGNLAFGLEDLDQRDILIMKERWKLIYGIETNEKIYIKWNIKINLKQKTLQGQMNIQDPNEDMSIPISSTINAYLKEMIFITDIRTVYSSSEKPILLQISIDQRLITQQYLSLKLIHESSKTNLSFTLDHHPQRKLLVRLKPNDFPLEKTLLHLYANTTESQLKLLFILVDQIHLNLTLPKSYPETGLLHSSLFIENEEYFDGRLDATMLKIRTKEYLWNISLNQFILFDRKMIRASILPRWIERNSSTALIQIFNQMNFQRISIPIWQSAEQNTWIQRFREFLFKNNLTSEFSGDLQQFFNYLKNDFMNEQGKFGVQLIDSLQLDEDFQFGLQRINHTALTIIETLFQISLFSEKVFQEYLNNLSCLIHHQNLLHLDLIQLTNLIINTFVYETIHTINKTSIMFNHFTHYPHSMSAILTYLTNEIVLNAYKFLNNFYLETKNYYLSKLIQYSYEIDFLIKISPLLSDSITYFSSDDIRAVVYLFNERLRRFLTIWLESPMEYKIMRTIASQLIELIEKFRFYLDDKFDFLLPTLKIYTPQIWMNNTTNQTFLLTWSKQRRNYSNFY